MLAACGLVIVGVLAHVGLGRLVASPWTMPDLTLIGLATVAMARPERALLPIAVGVVAVLPVAGQHPLQVGMLYGAAGLLVRRAASGWELVPGWVPVALVAAIELGLIAWWLLMDGFAQLTIAGPALWRIAATGACVPLARAVVERLLRAR